MSSFRTWVRPSPPVDPARNPLVAAASTENPIPSCPWLGLLHKLGSIFDAGFQSLFSSISILGGDLKATVYNRRVHRASASTIPTTGFGKLGLASLGRGRWGRTRYRWISGNNPNRHAADRGLQATLFVYVGTGFEWTTGGKSNTLRVLGTEQVLRSKLIENQDFLYRGRFRLIPSRSQWRGSVRLACITSELWGFCI